ncbi:MAG: hypothetical protein ABF617_14215 [Gluconobacter japonicus]|uniref:hypothetical protein n=1 Tax=Gluconobacter japonicus TaxID=376620 RepID=UPI0039EB6BD3
MSSCSRLGIMAAGALVTYVRLWGHVMLRDLAVGCCIAFVLVVAFLVAQIVWDEITRD